MQHRRRATLALIGFTLGVPAIPSLLSARADEPVWNPAFVKLDANRDGLLSRDELRGFPDYLRSFNRADLDGDARLNVDEFVHAEFISDRDRAAAYVDDGFIKARVKGAIAREMASEDRALEVGVEAYRGHVLLTGRVSDEGQVRKAVQAASGINGVLSVKSALVIK